MLTTALDFQRKRQFSAAEQIYRSILASDPSHVDALHLLGLVCSETGRRDEAIQWISQALRLRPDFADAHFNLGKVFSDTGRLGEAVASYQHALRWNPNFAEASFNLANTWRDLGRFEEAVKSYEHAIRIKPKYHKAYSNLGNVLLELDRHDEALRVFAEVFAFHPDRATAHYNLANALQKSGKRVEALHHCEEALKLRPQDVQSICFRGVLMLDADEPELAARYFQEAIRLDPNYARAHFNLGIVQLMLGEWESGWEEYEWRWKTPNYSSLVLPKPRWDGSSLLGKTILLHPEQGLGDTLNFVRFASVLQKMGGRVIVSGPASMKPILQSCPGVAETVTDLQAETRYDVHCPMLSLPHALGLKMNEVAPSVPYLFANPELVAHWSKELGSIREFKIGIAWQGNPKYASDRHRSFPLTCFETLAHCPGVRLFSLQKGFGMEQMAALNGRFEVTDLGSRLDTDTGAFMDTAAVMQHLDLVIACDSAINHLAGALGVQAWLLNAKTPNWRWMMERADSPWYPSMRLFRQKTAGDWEGVFREVRTALEAKLHAREAAKLF